MIRHYIEQVVQRHDLSEAEMIAAMTEIMEGRASDAQIAAFITGLRMKGETIDEITGAARVMRQKATPVPVAGAAVSLDRDDITIDEETIVDTCGTGGDGTNTFNISTATAFVVAAAGLKVAKHGNRSVSSQCGSADVIRALGVNLDLSPEQVGCCVAEVGIGFLFAPLLHSAMKYAIGPRREIGIRTIFNLLGPLTNPAGAGVQVLGVYDPALTMVIAGVLQRLGARHAMVVHGEGCLDEMSLVGATRISRLQEGEITTFSLTPEDAGLASAPLSAVKGGDATANARILLDIFAGQLGPRRDVVLLNAAAVFVTAGLAADFRRGVTIAAEAIDSGKALSKVERLIAFSNQLAGE
ncbi:MAG: anthranilate phosphoribosyltransferase [Deltaproteobacteria bacterium]|nr:anthranilate phosphoribosyltransferase [Candidatus Anaeroferrophillus wilburensis]MBN2888548.1 anthranilate phosphoribosyltransferase [Deltaproteobacteria bacterium]